MKKWYFWIGVLFSLGFLTLAVNGLDLSKVWQALTGAQYLWLLPGIAVYFIGVWVRAWRWHYLLHPVQDISTRRMFPVVVIGYMGNNTFPARAGEVLRAVVLKRREGVSASASLATIIVERVFDGVVMLGFVFLNLPRLTALAGESDLGSKIHLLAVLGVGIFLAALLVFLLAAMFPTTAEKFIAALVNRLLPKGLREKVLGLAFRFLDGLAALRSPLHSLTIFSITVVIWLLETGKYWFVMHAFPFQVDFFTLLLLNGVINLVSMIPSAPGYIGTWEVVGKAVLVSAGVAGNLALAYILVLHAALWLPITALGAFFLAREGLHWSQAVELTQGNPNGEL